MRLPGLVLLAVATAASNLALQEPGGPSFAGSWTGSGKFTTGAPEAPCRYSGAATPPAVVVALEEKDGGWSGQVALDLAGPAGTSCASIKVRYRILDARVSGNSLAFTDAAGNEWSLTLREGRLQGIVSSPRLGGEVSLARGGEREATPPAAAGGTAPSAPGPAAGASASPAPGAAKKPAAHGSAWGGIATATVVSAVGAAAFLGVNKLLQDSGTGQGGGPTCSLRTCIVAVPDCDCDNPTITTGASCGTTPSGVTPGGICNIPSLPCQSDLSCNNGLCQTKFESCPF